MPPRFKFSKGEIAGAAYALARERGMDAVTARDVACKLGASPKVIFGSFRDMEELKTAVIDNARGLYKSYIERGLGCDIPFKGVGEQYIRFAKDEPQLFRILFMSKGSSVPPLSDVLGTIENSYEKILGGIEHAYGLPRERSEELYRHLWIYSHGIAVLFATNVCAISDEEVSRMLSDVFRGILISFKTGGQNDKG